MFLTRLFHFPLFEWYMSINIVVVLIMFTLYYCKWSEILFGIQSIGISSKKLESWLDQQDEDLNELREELKKERKQHENTLRVTSSSDYFHPKLTTILF